jgi:hypothetical protein
MAERGRQTASCLCKGRHEILDVIMPRKGVKPASTRTAEPIMSRPSGTW